MKKKVLILCLILSLALLSFAFVACTGGEKEQEVTLDALNTDVGTAFDVIEAIRAVSVDKDAKTIACTVENTVQTLDLSALKIEGGTLSVYQDEAHTQAITTVTLAEGENVFYVVAAKGALSASYKLTVTRSAASDHVHAFSAWRTVKAPTCKEKGSKERVCACGEKETAELAVVGHDYQYNKCKYCGRWTDEERPATQGLIFRLIEEEDEMDFYVQMELGTYMLVGYEGTDTDIVIPETYEGKPVTAWNFGAFNNYAYITSVVIPKSITLIEDSFYYSLLQDVIYEGTLSDWMKIKTGWSESYSPLNNQSTLYIDHEPIKTLVIPEGTTTVPGHIFGGGTFTEVIIPEGVTTIGWDAFYGCNYLKKVTIPSTVTHIGESMLQNCARLESVYFNGTLEQWCAIDFDHYVSPPISYSHDFYIGGELLTELVIPENVTTVKYGAFGGCTSLRKVVLHQNVEEIEKDAFVNCRNLTLVVNDSALALEIASEENGSVARYAERIVTSQDESVEKPSELIREGDCLIRIEENGEKTLVEYLGREATTFTVPDGITRIEEDAFQMHVELTEIIVSDGVTTIEENAFYDTLCLKVTLGAGVTVFEGGGQDICKTVQVRNNSELDMTIWEFFYGEEGKDLPEGIEQEFYDHLGVTLDLYEIKKPGEEFTGELIFNEDGVILYRFEDATYLIGYTGKGSVVDLSEYTITNVFFAALFGDRTVETVILPEGVTEIASGAFAESEIVEFYLPRSLKKVWPGAFSGIDGTITIHYAGTKAEWDAIEWIPEEPDEEAEPVFAIVYCSDGRKLPHIHRWEDVVVREATCTRCELTTTRCKDCGEYGSGISAFNRLDHEYDNDGVCIYCHNEPDMFFTAYPYFAKGDEVEYYSVGYYGTEKTITIPSTYNGKPVTMISSMDDIVDDELVSIVLPASIDRLYAWQISSEKIRWVYYLGTLAEKENIDIWGSGTMFSDYAIWYYYSETEPEEAGNFWHYGEDGGVLVWE